MTKKYEMIMNDVVSNNYCCGCGICSGICPKQVISMKWDDSGAFKPFIENSGACIDCGLCIKVCPFVNGNADEKVIADNKFPVMGQIQFHSETGYYHNSYVGFAQNEIREKSASGGLLTWLLIHLLETGQVDQIITSKPSLNGKRLFEITVATSKEDLLNCTGSVYYPLEMSDAISYLLGNEGRYAIVGLPCFVKGLEHLKRTSIKAKERILFTIGLTCGQLKTKKFTDYIYSMTTLKSEMPSKVFYRKIKGPLNSDFCVEFTDESGNTEDLDWYPHVAPVWGGELFKLKSCFHCDDVFAECADATFMDAWLPEYSNEYKGVSLVLNRNPLFDSFFENAPDLESVSIDKVIESQDMVLKSKRGYREIIDRTALKSSDYVPIKRDLRWDKKNISKFEKNKKLLRYKYADILLDSNTETGRSEISSIVQRLNNPPLIQRFIRKAKRVPLKINKIIRRIAK